MSFMTRSGAAAFAFALPLTLLSAAGPAQADEGLVGFQYTATLDATAVGGSANENATVTFFYDPNLEPFDSSATHAQYGPLADIAVELGDQCFSLSNVGTAVVLDNAGPNFAEDSFDAHLNEEEITGTTLLGWAVESVQVVTVDEQSAMFDSTALPRSLDNLNEADFTQLVISLRDGKKRENLFDQSPVPLRAYDPASTVRALHARVSALPKGIGSGMIAQLDRALTFLEDANPSNDHRADTSLSTFIRMVDAAEASGKPPADQAGGLRKSANRVIRDTPDC